MGVEITPPQTLGEHIVDFVVDHRGWFVTFFLVPLQILGDIVLYLLSQYDRYTRKQSTHQERVARIQQQIKNAPQGAKLCTARPGWKTMSLKTPKYKTDPAWYGIDLGNLDHILHVDEARGVVTVEPMCSMGQITKELLPRGWTLAVIPELDDLTVGGLISGFGIETSSHKYGLFQYCCSAYDIILPSGELLHCTQTENPDLFAAIPWSHGTLGFLVSAEIKIIRAKEYVRIEYIPCHNTATGIKSFADASNDDSIDFVESLQYSPSTSVVMRGYLTNDAPANKINKINAWYNPWFYKHVESFLSKSKGLEGAKYEEYIPLRDYYHRHTRSIFWELEEIIPFGNETWYRYLFGWMGSPKVSTLKVTTWGKLKVLYEHNHVAQDMLVPMDQLDASLKIFDEEFAIYPLWLCPMRILAPPLSSTPSNLTNHFRPVTSPKGGLIHPTPTSQLFVDIGAYGTPKSKRFDWKASVKRVEAFVIEKEGYQALYADTWMSNEEFRKMFDHEGYDAVRRKYAVEGRLSDIYTKVNRGARRL